MVKNKQWKELTVVTAITLVSGLYAVDFYYHLGIMPNPNTILHRLEPAAKALGTFFNLP